MSPKRSLQERAHPQLGKPPKWSYHYVVEINNRVYDLQLCLKYQGMTWERYMAHMFSPETITTLRITRRIRYKKPIAGGNE